MVFSNNSNKNDYDQHKAKIVSSYEEDWGKKKEKNDPCKCQNGNREVITSTDICYCNIKQDNRLKFENYLNQILHFLVDTSFDIKYDDSVEKARALVPKLSGNLFETSKVILNQWYPVIAAEEVNRPLIVSKFFRSIIIVNFITLVLPLLNYIKYSCRDSIFCLTFILVLICLLIILKIVLKIVYNQFFSFCCAIGSVLLIGLTTALIFKNLYYSFVAAILFFSFREYIRQRYKSTQAAYRAFVNLYNWQNDTKPKEPQNQLLSILLPKANKAKKMWWNCWMSKATQVNKKYRFLHLHLSFLFSQKYPTLVGGSATIWKPLNLRHKTWL